MLKPQKEKAQNHAQSQFLTVQLENHRKTLKDNTDTESNASSNWSKENMGKLNVKRISMSREQLSKPTRQSRRDVVKMLCKLLKFNGGKMNNFITYFNP